MSIFNKKNESQVEKADGQKIEMTRDLPVLVPATDIYEKDDSILVVCDMPGVGDKDIDITVENKILTISGHQDLQSPEKHERIYRGFSNGIFRRSFQLSSEADDSKINAKLSNGVLSVVIGKAEKAIPRKIKVEAE